MIKSMTGYGRASLSARGREITAEVRSVNNRYMDCGVRLPRLYAFAEEAVRKRVKENIARGKVDVYFTVTVSGEDTADITLNRPLLERYLAALRSIADDFGVTNDITVSSVARNQDVFIIKKTEQDEAQIIADLLQALDQALTAYNAMRTAEGQALARDVRSRAGTIKKLVEKIEARAPQTVAEYRAKLTARLEEVLSKQGIDENRIITEAAIFADRVAVDEETVRLRSHLSQLEGMLETGSPIGRKLDFLLQELNREANTIGSKSSDLELTRTVVEIKAELEKIREQIQNIE